MTKIINIFINCPTVEVADVIAEHLLDRRLVAAVNRHPSIVSSYTWRGKRVTRPEIPLQVRTRAQLFEAVAEAASTHHPDKTPSVIGITVDEVSADYAAWVDEVTDAS